MRRSRLTDNDINLGPITIGEPSKHWRPIGITLESGEEEYPGCSLKLYTGWRTIRIALPQIIKPWRRWVDCSHYQWADGPHAGYWDEHRREFGFRLSDGFLQVFLGPQTHDSTTTKSWCTHLPWTQWRHVRHSMYGLQGEHFWTEVTAQRRSWDDFHKARESCPTANFLIEDYDGARITAKTRIEEREWRFGEKWCSWLSVFRKPRVTRSLDIDFCAEVGLDKGSWKGGMTGHGIDMLPGELHEAAFRRYCEQEVRSKNGRSRITFLGLA
jgi:hypothetical protein